MPVTLQRLDLRGHRGPLLSRLPRPEVAGEGPVSVVKAVLAEVRTGGDAAVRAFTSRFDGVTLDELRVPRSEIDAALAATPVPLRNALEVAREAIESYHRTQLHDEVTHHHNGVEVRELRRPVGRAGLYVPGGRARYPSSVLMTAIPARVAGVPELALCVPPDRDGSVAGPTLAAAAIAGVDEVYRIGGAQAVGAMAYGTESLGAVDVIVGPGNVYVSIAKREVAQEGRVGVPSAFAGPSEVVVIADESVPVEFVAIDVILQAEHGPDGLAWLVTWSEEVADAVTETVATFVERSPRRADIEATLATGGYAVLVDGPEQALEVANGIAPEHLELMVSDPQSLLPMVQNAGAVFCGQYSPASVGDYLAGPNHVLPTYGSARFAGALRVDDFCKHIHVVTIGREALAELAPHVAVLAEAEGLPAHAASVRMRVSELPV